MHFSTGVQYLPDVQDVIECLKMLLLLLSGSVHDKICLSEPCEAFGRFWGTCAIRSRLDRLRSDFEFDIVCR